MYSAGWIPGRQLIPQQQYDQKHWWFWSHDIYKMLCILKLETGPRLNYTLHDLCLSRELLVKAIGAYMLLKADTDRG